MLILPTDYDHFFFLLLLLKKKNQGNKMYSARSIHKGYISFLSI